MTATMQNVETPRWRSYVAVGDSFTEGLWDPYPDVTDHQRGWADLLALRLTERRLAQGADPLHYANLAIRGRKLHAIITEQVPVALEMKPDLVSLIGGGNDILRPSADIEKLASDLDEAVGALRAAGCDVLIGTGFDASGNPLVSLTRGRTGIFNAHLWSIARRRGAYVLDLWGMRSLQDWRMWADDRIHLTPDGHQRVLQAALVGLGLPPDDARWDDPLVPLDPPPAIDRALQHATWMRHHVVPWAGRRIRGVSSGDNRAAKAPTLIPVAGHLGESAGAARVESPPTPSASPPTPSAVAPRRYR